MQLNIWSVPPGARISGNDSVPDDVDDAIGSRCIARLVYGVPGPDDAARIWTVLAETAGIKISRKAIAEIVMENPEMTGRDIKNVLKLAGLMDGAAGGVSAEQVKYVQQFKPTGVLPEVAR